VKTRLVAGCAAAAAALFLFLYLAGEVRSGEALGFDTAVREAIHAYSTPRLTYAMRGITWLGSPAFLVSAVVILVIRLAKMGRRRAATLLVFSSLGGEAFDEALKLVFRRTRPEPFFGYTLPETFSFPSGHAVASCCFFGMAAAILTKRMESPAVKAAIWIAAAFVVFAIGLSRVYLGVHYPTDVIGGYAAAIVWIAAVRAAYELWLRRALRPTR
jgi:undecaprenyl-diphosphatase